LTTPNVMSTRCFWCSWLCACFTI